MVYNIDLPPTLCELLGIPVPPGWDGQSFAPAVRGEPWRGRRFLVWEHGVYSCQRAVRTPNWLFIRTYHPGLFRFDELALYDISADPHQTTDVSGEHGSVVDELQDVLDDWLARNVPSEGDPMAEIIRSGPWRYVQPDRWIARLRRRGRDTDAGKIADRLAGHTRRV